MKACNVSHCDADFLLDLNAVELIIKMYFAKTRREFFNFCKLVRPYIVLENKKVDLKVWRASILKILNFRAG